MDLRYARREYAAWAARETARRPKAPAEPPAP
jgi:hypothetical protein